VDNIRKIERTGRGAWTGEALGSLLGLEPKALSVFCSRAVKRGDLVRVKRGVFALPGWIERADELDVFALSNILQTPSYVSLSTALSYRGTTTQIVRSSCEAISPVRTASYRVEGFELKFVKLPDRLYFGFELDRGAFVAEPEKALLDALYLASLGRYSLDMSSLERDLFDEQKLAVYARRFPARTARQLARIEELR
jgi:predicted transcriptional regulator of viral defense system